MASINKGTDTDTGDNKVINEEINNKKNNINTEVDVDEMDKIERSDNINMIFGINELNKLN